MQGACAKIYKYLQSFFFLARDEKAKIPVIRWERLRLIMLGWCRVCWQVSTQDDWFIHIQLVPPLCWCHVEICKPAETQMHVTGVRIALLLTSDAFLSTEADCVFISLK